MPYIMSMTLYVNLSIKNHLFLLFTQLSRTSNTYLNIINIFFRKYTFDLGPILQNF